jgi:hypothetical protein
VADQILAALQYLLRYLTLQGTPLFFAQLQSATGKYPPPLKNMIQVRVCAAGVCFRALERVSLCACVRMRSLICLRSACTYQCDSLSDLLSVSLL